MFSDHISGGKQFFKGFEPLEPRVLLSGVGNGPPEVIPGQYIVVLNEGVDPQDFANDQTGKGAEIGHVYRDAIRGVLLRGNAPTDDARVAYIEPDFAVHATAQTVPTGITRIGAHLNPIAGIDGNGGNVDVDVAILDTGLDASHPDLNVVGGFNAGKGPAHRWDDGNGHGTHVGGTIGALDNDFGVVGVAPGARLWGVKVLGNSGSGSLSDIIAGIDWVTANANVIEVANMSLSGVGYSSAARTAIAASVNAGVVYIVAAGNDARDVYGPDGIFGTNDDTFPASFPEVAAISALADSDGAGGGVGGSNSYGPDDVMASFSNYGRNVVAGNPVTSSGGAIDLALPGVDILSTYPGGYAIASGTSMASPHAAGLAALYIAENGRANNAAGVYAIRQSLIDAADAPTGSNGYNVLTDRDARHEPVGNGQGAPLDLHDVAIASLVANPAAVLVGESASAAVTVQNNGTYSEAFNVQIVSDNGTPGSTGDDIVVGSWVGVVLGAGNSAVLTTGSFSTGAAPGTVTLTASHTLSDENTGNDSATATINVDVATTDIALASIGAPDDVTQGDVVDVDVVVENRGNQDVTGDIVVTLVDTTDGGTIGTATIVGGLAAGASTTVTISWDTAGASIASHILGVSHNIGDDDSGNDALAAIVNVNEEVISNLSIAGITPSTIGVNTPTSVTITGTGFVSGASIVFGNGAGQSPEVTNVVVVNDTTITATFTAGDKGPKRDRVWDISVVNPSGESATLSGGLTVSLSGGADLGVKSEDDGDSEINIVIIQHDADVEVLTVELQSLPEIDVDVPVDHVDLPTTPNEKASESNKGKGNGHARSVLDALLDGPITLTTL